MPAISLPSQIDISKMQADQISSNSTNRSRSLISDKEKPIQPSIHSSASLREKVLSVQRNSLITCKETWITGALALGTIACLTISMHSKPDPIATEISDAQGIETLTTLGGMPIETLEQLEHTDGIGLLNAGDTIKAILQKDWKTVSILGLTHFKIAQILQALWDKAHLKIKQVTFNPRSLKNEFLGNHLTYQTLDIVGYFPCKCFFHDPYKNFTKTWKTPNYHDYLKISNPNTKQIIEIRSGMVGLIKKFGFYANGSARVDPVQLIAVLTGQNPTDLQRRIDSAATA